MDLRKEVSLDSPWKDWTWTTDTPLTALDISPVHQPD